MSDNSGLKNGADREDGTPRFSLKGAKAYLYEYEGYSGGHEELDRFIKLLKRNGIRFVEPPLVLRLDITPS
jgi:hypothetical protein